jgi:transcription elongation GreA/GreB family factor
MGRASAVVLDFRAVSPPPKFVLKEQLVRTLAADLDLRERAYRASREAATHAEAKPENDKDTRALEQSYLARGEALRLEEQRAALAEVEAMPAEPFDETGPVRLGALVEIEQEGQTGQAAQVAFYWILSHGGGTRLAEGSVLVVTPKSPLGGALLGRRAGDECEVVLAGKPRLVQIVAIS